MPAYTDYTPLYSVHDSRYRQDGIRLCVQYSTCSSGQSSGESIPSRHWLDGDLSRAEAVELVGADEADVALATYVETHDPVPELADAVAGVREPDANATVQKRDALAETMSSVGDLR